MISDRAWQATRTQPRSAGRLMLDPVFASFFWGRFSSSAGVWVHSIVSAILVYDLTGSVMLVGLVSVVQFAPQLVLTPWAGTWADRGNAFGQIVGGRAMCAIGSATIAGWLALSADESPMRDALVVLGASLLVGLGFVVGGPAMQSVVPRLVRPGELAAAMSLNTVPMTTSRIVGPATGAYLYADPGPVVAFAVAALAHLVFVVLLLVTPWPGERPASSGVDYSVRAALRHVRTHPPLALLLVAVTFIGFGTEPSTTLSPALVDDLGRGPGLVGALSSAFGVGAALGLVVIWVRGARLRPASMASWGIWAMAIGLLVTAATGSAWQAIGSYAVTGMGFSLAITGVSTLVQSGVPYALRGRVMALWLVGFVGSRPLAALTLGAVADTVSVRAAFALTGLLLGLVATRCRPRVLDLSQFSQSSPADALRPVEY